MTLGLSADSVFRVHLLPAGTGVAVVTRTDVVPQSLCSGGRLMINKEEKVSRRS